MISRYFDAAVWVAAAAAAATVAVAQSGTTIWREGPITIEAPRAGIVWSNPVMYSEILRVDADGVITRHGRHLDQVHRDELLEIIQEIVALEMMKSRPSR